MFDTVFDYHMRTIKTTRFLYLTLAEGQQLSLIIQIKVITERIPAESTLHLMVMSN